MLEAGAQRTTPRDDRAIRQWRAHRLGQFVHFGLYSIPAGTWRGKTVDFAAEFLPHSLEIPSAEWVRLADQFRLERFDAREWARVAKQAGAGYVVITTKHHEGFCLWPSELTTLHVGNTPFGRDLLGELVEAYRAEGIDVVLYYSVLDWSHPDWRYSEETEEDKLAGERYRAYALGQCLELARRYPSVVGFWFDGTWDESIKANGRWTLEVEKALKRAIDGCIVNSRLRADEHGNRHVDGEGNLMGDYESGYERRLPEPWDVEVARRDWEACMTIPEHTWGHHAGSWARDSRKDWRDVVDQLAHAVSLNGNFLLNVGPRGDGSHDPDDVEVTQAVGKWVEAHEGAIRRAGHEPRLSAPKWGYYTLNQDGRTWAVVTRVPVSLRLRVSGQGMALEDVRVQGAEVVWLSPSLLELRLSSAPTEPLALSFVLSESTETAHDVNPDVVD